MAIAGSEGECENDKHHFEEMEFLDDDAFSINHFSDGNEPDEEDGAILDFHIEAHEREFKAQKKDKSLDVLHIRANNKDQFERQIWCAYNSVLRREILYQRAEEGCEEQVEWSPITTPCWEDRDRFFRLQYKRNSIRLSDLTDDFLTSLKGLTVKLSVFVYSDSLISAKDFDRAKEILSLGKRVGGLKDRSGADANHSLMRLVLKLKSENKNRFVNPLDASFVLWANYIQCSSAHLRDDLITASPPDHLKNLFTEIDESSAHAVLSDSIEDATIAETVHENFEIIIAEIEAAFEELESNVTKLRSKIEQFKACRRNNKSLISAFKRSLKVTEGEESRLYAENVVDCPDVDHM